MHHILITMSFLCSLVPEALSKDLVIGQVVPRVGASPTRERVIQQLENLDNLGVGGFKLSFSPTSRVGSKFVEVSVIGRPGS